MLTKSGMFVGKGYSYDDMFKLIFCDINKASSIVYMLSSSIKVLHTRLYYINTYHVKNTSDLGLLSILNNDEFEQCLSCS